MEQRRFGHSDLACAPLGFGTWEMGSGQTHYTKYGEIDYDEAVRAVHEEIKAAGKCLYIGICNLSVSMLRECERYGRLTAVQVGYHIFDRRVEAEVLPYCLEKHIGFMSYGTLGFGLCTGALTPSTPFLEWDWRSKGKAFGLPLFEGEWFRKELAAVERLKALAAQFDRSMPQLAIAWAIGHPAVTVSLVGIRKPAELLEDVRAVDWKLSAEIRAEVDRILAEEGVPTYADRPELQAV